MVRIVNSLSKFTRAHTHTHTHRERERERHTDTHTHTRALFTLTFENRLSWRSCWSIIRMTRW